MEIVLKRIAKKNSYTIGRLYILKDEEVESVVHSSWMNPQLKRWFEHKIDADELTGLIGAAALMRPSRSVQDMELKSLKKKFKDRKFAAGCSRDVIITGAERLGWELDVLLEKTLDAMRSCEAQIAEEMAKL